MIAAKNNTPNIVHLYITSQLNAKHLQNSHD